jgi:hypothetical protein
MNDTPTAPISDWETFWSAFDTAGPSRKLELADGQLRQLDAFDEKWARELVHRLSTQLAGTDSLADVAEFIETLESLRPDTFHGRETWFRVRDLETRLLAGLEVSDELVREIVSAMPKRPDTVTTAIVWALYHGDDEIGVTVHTMSSELDRGEAIVRRSFPVNDDDTLDDVIIRGKVEGAGAAVDALEAVHEGSVEADPIDGDGSYFSFPTREERREFQRRGWELL